MARNFTEGWVEFLSKRVAKEVAAKLNTVQVKIFVNLFFLRPRRPSGTVAAGSFASHGCHINRG